MQILIISITRYIFPCIGISNSGILREEISNENTLLAFSRKPQTLPTNHLTNSVPTQAHLRASKSSLGSSFSEPALGPVLALVNTM